MAKKKVKYVVGEDGKVFKYLEPLTPYWERLANDLARAVTSITDCRNCGGPRQIGYKCERCGGE